MNELFQDWNILQESMEMNMNLRSTEADDAIKLGSHSHTPNSANGHNWS